MMPTEKEYLAEIESLTNTIRDMTRQYNTMRNRYYALRASMMLIKTRLKRISEDIQINSNKTVSYCTGGRKGSGNWKPEEP